MYIDQALRGKPTTTATKKVNIKTAYNSAKNVT